MRKSPKNTLEHLLKKVSQSGVDNGVFSGCAAAVSSGSGKSRQRFFSYAGKNGYSPVYPLVDSSTFFDLASLTKPLCTVLSLLVLLEQKKIDWDTPLFHCLQEWEKEGEKGAIQIRHLLSHCSGLAAYAPYYRLFDPILDPANKKRLLQHLYGEKLVYGVGRQNLYSDLGYILLGEVIERLSGRRLDAFYRENVTRRLNLERHLFFLSLFDSPEVKLSGKIAATEYCGWRQRLIAGEVHDEHCWLMGGVAGHAGLFGDAEGVLALCEYLLDLWKGKTSSCLCSATAVERLFRRPPEGLSWYMGFDTPTPGKSSSGQYFSSSSAGHLGFSGTSFWIDPQREVVVVLLTNRIHPTRTNEKIRQFRPYFHNQVMECICR